MKRLQRVAAITLMFLRPALRRPMLTLLVSMLPVSFIVIFMLIGGAELSRHALYGTLVVFATNVGVVSMPQLALGYRLRNLQGMFVASPVSALMYAAGMGLSRLAWAAPGLGIVMAVLVWTGGMPASNLPAVMLVVLVTWFTGVMIGFSTASYFHSAVMVGTIANLMGMLLSVLPPIYYPLEFVPAGWRWLPMLLPTTNAAQLVRVAGGISESSASMVALHWGILLGFAAVCSVAFVSKAQWREA